MSVTVGSNKSRSLHSPINGSNNSQISKGRHHPLHKGMILSKPTLSP